MFISKLSFWCNFLNKRGCVFLRNIRKMCSLVEKKNFQGSLFTACDSRSINKKVLLGEIVTGYSSNLAQVHSVV